MGQTFRQTNRGTLHDRIAMGKEKGLRLEFSKNGQRPERLFFLLPVFLRKQAQPLRLKVDQGISKDQDTLVQEGRLSGTESWQCDGFHPGHGIT